MPHLLHRRQACGLILGSLGLFSPLLSQAAPAQAIADVYLAINIAGKERALSQRMAKAFLQLGLGVDEHRSRTALSSSMAMFERQLLALLQFAPTPLIRGTYEQLERNWASYKTALGPATPTQDQGKEVLALSEMVLRLANQGVVQLEEFAGTTSGRLVNLSGRQRMLSQRMAKLYQAQAWGIADGTAQQDITVARQEFAQAHQALSEEKSNTEAIRSALALVQPQWVFFENALAKPALAGSKQSRDIATTSERIYEQLDVIAGLYAQAGQKK